MPRWLADGSLAPNLYIQRSLRITDQAGINATVSLWGNNYLEGNIGYLRAYSTGDREPAVRYALSSPSPHASRLRPRAASTKP